MDLFPYFMETDEDLLVYHCLTVKKRKYNILCKSKSSFDFSTLTNEFCWVHFRFYKEDILKLKTALQIPDKVPCLKRVKVTGIEALCIVLKRLAYPNRYCQV